jgi:hypothetical protein
VIEQTTLDWTTLFTVPNVLGNRLWILRSMTKIVGLGALRTSVLQDAGCQSPALLIVVMCVLLD